jgi:hypothetical protein
MTASKIVAAAASGAAGGPTDVDDVFSCHVHIGTGGARSITNNINLSGEGGLVWFKQRDANRDHGLFDTARGTGKYLVSNDTNAEASTSTMLSAFNSDGFSIAGGGAITNNNNNSYVSWTFRKAEKFFDIVTWTGDGTGARTFSHNLGCDVGMILVKRTSSTEDWTGYHRGSNSGVNPETYKLLLNSTNGQAGSSHWNSTAPTATNFRIATYHNVNNETYVAYLFAHNNGNGEFGPDGDQDIIKCGHFLNSHNSDTNVNVGFEPQYLLVKRISGAGSWFILDTMRGITDHGGNADTGQAATVKAETTGDENNMDILEVTPTGFRSRENHQYLDGAEKYIYMAIRRGPLAVPEDATKVFHVNAFTGNGATGRKMTTNFIVDLNLTRGKANSHNPCLGTRLTDGMFETNASAIHYDTLSAWIDYDFSDGYEYPTVYSYSNNNTNPYIAYSWRRAPSFCDVVCYSGNGSTSQNVSHNLGVAPEMIWVKCRSHSEDWVVYHSSTGNGKYLVLSTTAAAANWTGAWNATSPTGSVFTVGNGNAVNLSGRNYIAHLFATASGVSKVGSYTGTGSAQNIDCGFSSGARFVLIKRTDTTDDWLFFDTSRGIVSGNDPYLALNTNDSEITSQDYVDPYSAGFAVTGENPVGANNGTYIFYAVA